MSPPQAAHQARPEWIPRVAMLGAGWFPDRRGGLDRYFTGLFGALPAELRRGVVLGPVADPPPGLVVAARHEDPLPWRLWRYGRAARRAGRGAQVVDAHFAPYAIGPSTFGLRRLPLVVHFHGPWAEESAMSGQGPIRVRAKFSIERVVYGRASAIVVLSTAFKRLVVERYRVKPWSVHVIPPGVDTTSFVPGDRDAARHRLGLPPRAFVGLAVRRLVPRMGIDVLLEAWARLAPEGERVLLIVGEGPEREALEVSAAGLAVADSVRFLGPVDDDALVACYQASDVCVMPSVALEGFGLVTLEALACGTPVIGTAVGGLAEVLGGLDDRLVVPAGDAAILTERLDQVRSGTLRLPSAESCRAHASTYSWRRVAESHRDVYAGTVRPSMRVVYLDHTAALGGAELGLLALLGAMEEVDAHVILAEDGPLATRLTRAGVSTEVLRMRESARSLRRDDVPAIGSRPGDVAGVAAYVLRLAARLRRLRPDLVHANTLKACFYGGAAARLAGVPMVWHLQDRVSDDYLPRSVVRLVRAAARRFPDAVMANSFATLDALGPVPVRAEVVYSPVAPPPSERPGPRTVGPLRIGAVGRLAPWKGQHVLLEAFARAFTDSSARAEIVGAAFFGDEAYARELRTRVRCLGIEDLVEFHGFRDDIWDVLTELDVLVHTSTIPEPFGRSVVEGMAAGLAVVATAAGGPSEVIEDGVSGLLYPPGDADALAACLRRLAAEHAFRHRLGVAARRRAADFDPERVAAAVADVYRRVLDRDRR